MVYHRIRGCAGRTDEGMRDNTILMDECGRTVQLWLVAVACGWRALRRSELRSELRRIRIPYTMVNPIHPLLKKGESPVNTLQQWPRWQYYYPPVSKSILRLLRIVMPASVLFRLQGPGLRVECWTEIYNRHPCHHQITIDSLSNGHQGHRVWNTRHYMKACKSVQCELC